MYRRFTISAPGRVFLSGDPTTYNNELCEALAASLDQRTTLNFTSTLYSCKQPEKRIIKINFNSIGLYTEMPLKALQGLYARERLNFRLTDAYLHNIVRNFVNSSMDKVQSYGNYDCNNRAHHVQISTELAIGEGLGSSASFATCLAACFYYWLQREDVCDGLELAAIWIFVDVCERVIYNSLTPIDSIVCVYGSIYPVQTKLPTKELGNIPSMKILLVSSNVSQKTILEQNEQMESMRQSYPFIESVQRNIDNVVKKIRDTLDDTEQKICQMNKALTGFALGIREEQKLIYMRTCCAQLATLIHMNQGLLRTLGMSHPNLDVICAIARQSSPLFAGKLTNIGGGGYAFILLSPDSTATSISPLLNKLRPHNFSVRMTNLICNGVRVEPT